MTRPPIICMIWNKSPDYSVTNISHLQMTSIITRVFAAVLMIQIACLTLPTTVLPEATIRIVINMHSNISMLFFLFFFWGVGVCRANRTEHARRLFLEIIWIRLINVRFQGVIFKNEK